tara:strand:- start:27493 stop:28428 length:936 start_codon:yes stop_codon:yes gene_type:complete
MSGILDKKTRILDSIVTYSGRQQIAAGKLKIEYASFTDTHTFYERDIVSGSSDAQSRLFFEAANTIHDQLTFETDDSGFMLPFSAEGAASLGSKVLSGSSGTKKQSAVKNSIQFNSAASDMLSGTIDSFEKNNVIGTKNAFLGHNKFNIDKLSMKFNIRPDAPFEQGDLSETSIDNVESLFQDKRLSHVANFLYLPPVNAATNTVGDKLPLGDYPDLGQNPMMKYEDLAAELKGREKETITFYETSLENNLIGQFFEIGQTTFKKLDVIDFGEFVTGDEDFPEKHVFFVGKVFPDSKDSYTFVNMFTLVFE